MMVVGVVIGEIVTMGFDEGQRARLSVGIMAEEGEGRVKYESWHFYHSTRILQHP